MIIAIDGTAAAGKGTTAKRLAGRYGLPYLDPGLLYRLIGKIMSESGIDLADGAAAARLARGIDPAQLLDPALRGHGAGELASRVAVHPELRAALLSYQREFAARPGGAVLDGRDIGSAVCPQADVKIYVTATPEVRALRRTNELRAKGRDVALATILAEIRERDRRDSGRAAAPLTMAADAYLLDTTDKDIEAAFRAAVDIVERAKVGLERRERL
ncbi:(d)CMP kinase [soil metagenome]